MKYLRRAGSGLACLALLVAAGCESGGGPPAEKLIASPYADKPLYQRKPQEIDAFLADLHARQPDFHQGMIEIARRDINQPYELYLLGEAPFERIDDQPIYNTHKSDCEVFVEHTLAMAMSDSFPDFMRNLQRIRYKDGVIGVTSRNHYTETDWNPNNAWLARDITDELGGEHVKHFTQTVDRQKFFKTRYKLPTTFPTQKDTQSYIPDSEIDAIKPKLHTGDIVQVVKGTADDSAWVHHFGLIAVQPDGEVHIIESNVPRVREWRLDDFIAWQNDHNAEHDAKHEARHRGFKFLRPVDDPIAALRSVDGSDVARVTIPADSRMTLEAYTQRELQRNR